MPAAPDATQIAARSEQINQLFTTCLGEEPQPALIKQVIDQTTKKISAVQSTCGSQITGTLTRTADKVYADLLKRLDIGQAKLLRSGYVELWGEISGEIKEQFKLHLDRN